MSTAPATIMNDTMITSDINNASGLDTLVADKFVNVFASAFMPANVNSFAIKLDSSVAGCCGVGCIVGIVGADNDVTVTDVSVGLGEDSGV